jgi:hypothetical protein
MRRSGIAALAALALASAPGAGAASGVAPTVRFDSLVPVKVHGAHFLPSERVTVTLHAGGTKLARTVRASRAGAIAVDFGGIAERDRCSGSVSIVAAGWRGDRAVYRLPTLVCPTGVIDEAAAARAAKMQPAGQ